MAGIQKTLYCGTEEKKDLIDEIKARSKKGKVTFIYAAHDEEHNSAVVLRGYLDS